MAKNDTKKVALAKPKKEKVVALRALLIKADFTDPATILKDMKLDEHPLDANLPFSAILYVKPQEKSVPSWVAFIKPHINGDLSKLKTASTAAVLLVKVDGRTIAFTFGHGRNLLNPEAWERDFGLKVALNTVAVKSLRSVDCRTFEELTLQTRRQLSRASGFDRFGLNVTQDLVRQVTGVPENEAFARRVAGSDGLMFAVPLALPGLGAKCSELLTEYANDAYKTKGFEFIDYLHCERDPVRIDELNAKLITTLESGNFDGVHLAPPEPIDDQEVDCFTFAPSQDAEEYQQLEVGRLLEALDGQAVTWDGLKAIRVCIRHPNTTVPIAKWPATQCLVYELQDGDDRFVLTCGDWYRIHKKFVDKVAAKVTALSAAATLALPPAKTSHDEGAYNAAVGKMPGFILMDKKCSRAFGDAIEACDLFTTKKQFVHVKRKTRSATLSHLFSQGVISADSFMDEEAYRVDVKKLVDAKDKALGNQMPVGDRPTARDFEVIYAILSKPTKDWPLSLPFFSQLNLMNAANHLERMGFTVSLVHVPQN